MSISAPREIVDDLHEVRVVADEQHALVRARAGRQPERVVDAEAARQGRVDDDPLVAELLAREPRGFQCAHAGAGEHELKRDAERGERAPGRARLLLAALGEPAIGVGARVVRLGLAVPQEPQLLCHDRESRRSAESGAVRPLAR